MHMRVFSEFNGLRLISSEVHVPRCHWFASANDNDNEWWSEFENLEKFPKGYRSRNNVMCCEHILPQIIREILIHEYCPVNLRMEVKSDPSNRDCLVRLYFGKRRDGSSPSKFSAPRRSDGRTRIRCQQDCSQHGRRPRCHAPARQN